jgi:LmbE family N-acetylglucosaminyl deacetylase
MRAILASAIFLIALVARPITQTASLDSGAAGTWQKLLKLNSTGSVMHTTAHPDDEHGGMLALMSRGQGARVSLLTLTRGESGDNAIGSELFDSLGLIRTEELMIANRHYGIDRQYFTSVVDYGFSKRLDEALEKWGQDDVLREVVRAIRTDRPFVLVSRFQGNPRDGHGNHEAAGFITQLAWDAAGDPNKFPEQLRDGLKPWQPFKLYIGGVRENEDWTVRLDAGEYSPVLGDSFSNLARLGLSFQRSQNSGNYNPQPGPSVGYYKLIRSRLPAGQDRAATPGGAKERGFFDGLDVQVSGLPALFGVPRLPAFAAIDASVEAAMKAFTIGDPSRIVPSLIKGLQATRQLTASASTDAETGFVLRIKEQQFQDAINSALGMTLAAVAQPEDTPAPTGPLSPFAPPPVMGPVVPGQRFVVRAALTNRSPLRVSAPRLRLDSVGDFQSEPEGPDREGLETNESAINRFTVTVAADAKLSRPYFSRAGLHEHRYTVHDATQAGRPARAPALIAVASFTMEGVPVELRHPVQIREGQLPYGYAMRELTVVPPVAVNVKPRMAIVPLATKDSVVPVSVELVNNRTGSLEGNLRLTLPDGWTASPPETPFTFARAGERRQFVFNVSPRGIERRDYRVEAAAIVEGKTYREGYDLLQKRDLETRVLYRSAVVDVRGIDVRVVPGLDVGYVMGIGDDVPAGIAQLGARVTLLSEQDLATGNLERFDAIVTGTRAYAIRGDLRTYNQRLLDYVRDGGNLIVLYNTQELDPKQFAPFPGELTARAEEVSEEDSPVEFLAPQHPVLRAPNAITSADFDGWVEQRGSKFWSQWDQAYTALIATHDKGQSPQHGGWLHARYGKGHYTYFAYAFHRQLPYGVPGAYRLLANLLSLSKM